MIVHATVGQLAEFTGEPPPDNAAVLLRSASLLVDAALLTTVYATDPAGKATDGRVLQALADATCAQAATWAALGINPAAGTAQPDGSAPVKSKKLGSGSIDYDTTAAVTAAQARTRAATELTGDAWQILAAAGLLTTGVWAHG